MKCSKCDKPAVIALQHGTLCAGHFLTYFEERVFKTIKQYRLFNERDVMAVACSGGKDSQTVLYLTKKYFLKQNLPLKNLWALAIDEGIKGYREKTLNDLKKFCKKEKITLKIISAKKELSYTLDAALKKLKQKKLPEKPCHICGVWRRYLINKAAREGKATKLVTGHNLDDEAQVFLMNLFKANTSLMSHLGPVTGISNHEFFVQRVKPLYLCPEKEVRLYSILKKFPVEFVECPYAQEGYRAQIRDMLNEFENKYRGTKQGIIQSFLTLMPMLKENARKGTGALLLCKKCGEPANQEVCHACKILEKLK